MSRSCSSFLSYRLKPLPPFTPHFHEPEPARDFWILEYVEEETFRLRRASSPDRPVCLLEGWDVVRPDSKLDEEGELFPRHG